MRIANMPASLGLLTSLFLSAGTALAQGYPTRPLLLIYPYASGGGLEPVMRQLNNEAGKRLGQPVVMENRPGANTRLGVYALRQAPADGYLITVVTDTLLVHQAILDPSFHPEPGQDYSPVTFLFRNSLVLAANSKVPFRDLQGLIAYAKANPGKLNWAFTPGSTTQFGMEMFKQAAGVNVAGIPYKGTGDALVALLSGIVDVQLSSSALKTHLDSGRLIALATTAKQRAGVFANLPTMQELGVPVVNETWFGVVTSAGVGSDVVSKLYRSFSEALKEPATLKLLQADDRIPDASMTPADFTSLIKSEKDVWGPILKKANLKLE